MKNKIKIPAILLYFLSILCIGFGIVTMIRADLGITVITSFPYSLSVITGLFTVGMWVTIIQCIVLLLAVILLKQLTVSMLASFITAYLLGVSIDVMTLLVQNLSFDTYIMRLLLVVFGSVMTGFGAGSLVYSTYPPIPDLVFIRDIADAKNVSLTKMKIIFDCIFLVMTVVLTLSVTGHIFAVGVGTAVSLLIIGFVVGQTNLLHEKTTQRIHFFSEEKERAFLEYNVLSLFNSANKKTTD